VAPVVYTHLKDGLGNQLFQYAAGRALAERNGARLRLDCGWFTKNTGRTFGLSAFSIDAEQDQAVGRVPARWFNLPGRAGGLLTAAVHNKIPRQTTIHGCRYKVFDEKRLYRFDPSFATLDGAVYLAGWWQSPRYFESSSAAVRRELELKAPLQESNAEWSAKTRSVTAVAVHVRRGDYLLSPDRATCSPAYYESAMGLLRSRLPGARFFVFSDDWEWCRHNMTACDTTVVDTNGHDSAAADLALMAMCRHHIIANSSLSWWGAWLSESPDQIVVAPKNWVVGVPTTDEFVASRWRNFVRI